MNPYIPSHLTEVLFRYFEGNIKLAVDNWPRETAFDLTLVPVAERYAPTTFVARMRDAIVSLKRFAWPTTINVEKLWSMSGKYVIAYGPEVNTIWFRVKGKHGRPTHMIGEARQRASVLAAGVDPIDVLESVVPLKDITSSELAALILLVGNKRIPSPILLEGNYATSSDLEFDVALTWDEKRNVTILT